MAKRKPRDVPARDDFWLGMALMLSASSQRLSYQGGAIIVSSVGHYETPLAFGFDVPPGNIRDPALSRHAEKVAMSNGRDMSGACMYVTHYPCPHCMMDIVEAGIRRIVYFPAGDERDWAKTQEIAQEGYVSLEKFKGNLHWMRDRIKGIQELGAFE